MIYGYIRVSTDKQTVENQGRWNYPDRRKLSGFCWREKYPNAKLHVYLVFTGQPLTISSKRDVIFGYTSGSRSGYNIWRTIHPEAGQDMGRAQKTFSGVFLEWNVLFSDEINIGQNWQQLNSRMSFYYGNILFPEQKPIAYKMETKYKVCRYNKDIGSETDILIMTEDKLPEI